MLLGTIMPTIMIHHMRNISPKVATVHGAGPMPSMSRIGIASPELMPISNMSPRAMPAASSHR